MPHFRNADELKAAGASHDEMVEEGKAVWARMGALANGRKTGGMTADDVREYDALEKIYDSIAELPEMKAVDRRGVIPTGQDPRGESSRPYRKDAPLAKDQTLTGYVEAMGHDLVPVEVQNALDDAGRDLSFSRFLRGSFTGDWRDAKPEQLLNALSGASAGAGGVMIPTVLSSRIIDLAAAQTRVLQAGAQTVPMESRTVDVARWLTDPTLAWRAENAAIATSDPTMDKITLVAKSLAAEVLASRELVEDTEIEAQLEMAFARALSLSVDLASLYGTGAANQPTGVKNTAAVTKTIITGANGGPPTWDALVDSVGRLRDQNEEPTAQIMADRTLRSLGKLKDTTNAYLAPPSYLEEIPRLATNQVPVNLTVGTSNDTSDVFTADWTQLLIGVRTQLQITVLKERHMPDAGQYGFVAWWRGDIAVARPKAFDVVTGVRP